MMSVHLKDQMGIKRISTDANRWHSFLMRRLLRHSCEKALTFEACTFGMFCFACFVFAVCIFVSFCFVLFFFCFVSFCFVCLFVFATSAIRFSAVASLRPCHTSAAYSTANEWRLTHVKRMPLTEEKNNMLKQRKLPNDECPSKGSNGHETHFRRISTDAKNGIRFSCDGLCGTCVTEPADLVTQVPHSAA